MPFANQGNDCDMKGNWHQSTAAPKFTNHSFKSPIFSSSAYQPFPFSSNYPDSAISSFSGFNKYPSLPHETKIGGFPDTHGTSPFHGSSLRGLRSWSSADKHSVESVNRSRAGSWRKDYDFDDVFCPSYVDRDTPKLRNRQNNSLANDNVPSFPKAIASARELWKESSSQQAIKGVKESKIRQYSPCVDTVAERALLLSMGWEESKEGEAENDISQQEIDEFYRLLRKSRITTGQAGRILLKARRSSEQTPLTPGLSMDSHVFGERDVYDDQLSSDDSLSVDGDD